LVSENRRSCTTHYLPHHIILDVALRRLNKIIAANLSADELLKMLHEEAVADKSAKKKLEKLKQRDNELRTIIRKIVEQNALGEISSNTFADLYNNYRQEQDLLKEKIGHFEKEMSAREDERENARKFTEAVKKYSHLTELTREIVLDLIEKIVVYEPTGGYRAGKREQVLEFHYRFIGQLSE
jgi:hypothetical protein